MLRASNTTMKVKKSLSYPVDWGNARWTPETTGTFKDRREVITDDRRDSDRRDGDRRQKKEPIDREDRRVRDRRAGDRRTGRDRRSRY